MYKDPNYLIPNIVKLKSWFVVYKDERKRLKCKAKREGEKYEVVNSTFS